MEESTIIFWLLISIVTSFALGGAYCTTQESKFEHEYRMEQLKRDCPVEGE